LVTSRPDRLYRGVLRRSLKPGNIVPGVTLQFKRKVDRRKTSASRQKLKFSEDD
jgi:hypothetical protein